MSKYNYSIINYKKLGECPPSPDKEKLIYPTEESLVKNTGMLTNYDQVLSLIPPTEENIYTFDYIWNYFKKGAFVHLVDSKVKTFIVFYNMSYSNPLKKYFKETYNLEVSNDSIFNWSYIKSDSYFKSDSWVPPYEIDDYYKLFTLLNFGSTGSSGSTGSTGSSGSSGSQLQGFILFRDTLLAAKDNNPWKHLRITPELEKHFINKPLANIFNDCGHVDFNDIPLPSTDDIKFLMGDFVKSTPFKSKADIAFFRGSATGTGDLIDNPRIFAASKSKEYPGLDIGITQKYSYHKIYFYKGRIVNTRSFINKMILSPKVPSTDYDKYKVLINIDGNIAANRKNTLLQYNSNIIGFKNQYYDWFDIYVQTKGCSPIKNYSTIEDIVLDLPKLFAELDPNIIKLKELYTMDSVIEYIRQLINYQLLITNY